MKPVKDILRRRSIKPIIIDITSNLNYEVELEFDPISDLIYWSLVAPLINNL